MAWTPKSKKVFLTGGAQGLGKGYTEALLAQGARVVFVDVNATVGDSTEAELQEKYGKGAVKFIAFDVTDGRQFEDAFKTAVEYLGNVDLMVNNAGIMMENVWEKMIQINYTALVRGTLIAVDHMRKDKGGKGGRIINVSSLAGVEDGEFVPIYVGTKQAVRSFTSSLAIAPDIKEQGVEFGVMCPGPAATDLVDKIDDKRIRYAHFLSSEEVNKVKAPVERIVEGFMKLLTLENMNGAILVATLDELTFCKMEKVNVGDTWPVPGTSN